MTETLHTPAPVAGSEEIELLDASLACTLAQELGLTTDEYHHVCEVQGRIPSLTELYIYSLMWSEHCSYKHSKNQLKKFPTSGPAVLQGPGENAGVVSLGDGWALAFKMESHNHPSAIEPFEGAATGIGGIVRDIFAMGARPVACMNSLRFGNLNQPRQRYLFEGAVAGIGSYGNCLGVPTVGGDIAFEDSYNGNCLVGAMCLGLLKEEELTHAIGAGIGNLVVLLGSTTGRDGIGGASVLASQEFDEEAANKRPAVQVGDPFEEKLLIEVCLELLKAGKFVALGDLGAAGLTSSASEMASRGGVGIEIDVTKVPQREPGMKPFEIMVSESQERMLAVVTPEDLADVEACAARWGVRCAVIGTITDTGRFVVTEAGKLVADMPAARLADEAPAYHPSASRPSYLDERAAVDPIRLLEAATSCATTHPTYNADVKRLLASPNICSRRWIWEQYDHQVQANTALLPGADAAVVRVGQTGRGDMSNLGFAVSTDCNTRYCYLNPRRGAAIALAEAMRNVSCTGAEPIAITDCLCFGNPEDPEIFYTFQECIEGLSDACRETEVPVISGNVSFYNETFGEAIYPSPLIGLVGKINDLSQVVKNSFVNEGDAIVVLGITRNELGASEYLKVMTGEAAGEVPQLNIADERALCQVLQRCAAQKLVHSAHDVSDGGLAVTLIESALAGKMSFDVTLAMDNLDARALLFGESQGRAVISCDPQQLEAVMKVAAEFGVEAAAVGTVTTSDKPLSIFGTQENQDNRIELVSLEFDEAQMVYEESLERLVHAS